MLGGNLGSLLYEDVSVMCFQCAPAEPIPEQCTDDKKKQEAMKWCRVLRSPAFYECNRQVSETEAITEYSVGWF